jgi:D-alanyl-lipoteichoic acid acyltransferase DltB (MBOAT superfamily)
MEKFPHRRRWFLMAGVAASIALLATFKYAGFVIENVNQALAGFGADPLRMTMRLVLPAGLSFYTFQSVGYLIDVYRGRVRAVHNLLDYALYVSFFPQLVAGPIERAAHMLPQYRNARIFEAGRWRTGLGLMLWGFFKKVVIADNVAVVANKVFALTNPSFPLIWAGVFAFAVQIYADFSGYTDIARGTARLLGIDLIKNFNHPYLASSPADFWRRWHISLSTWMRDFVYIPLGGSRCSAARASFNLMATFAISGLWHGASWNFVLWGIYWGLLILAQRFLRWLGVAQRIPWTIKVAITFSMTCFGWLLFRERNLHQLAIDLAQSPFATPIGHWQISLYLGALVLFYTLPLVIHMIASGIVAPRWDFEKWFSDRGRFALETSIAVYLFVTILVTRSLTSSDFIYFQF